MCHTHTKNNTRYYNITIITVIRMRMRDVRDCTYCRTEMTIQLQNYYNFHMILTSGISY